MSSVDGENAVRSYLHFFRSKIFIIIIFCVFLLGSSILFLRSQSTHDLGGYKLPSSPATSWETRDSPQPDFSNDDGWNESYIWTYFSSKRICNGDLAELNPYELNGSRYSAVGSTMSTAPQLALPCILPISQKALPLLLANLVLASLGLIFLIRLLFPQTPWWLGAAFAGTGPLLIYGTWPHSTTFAWIPLCLYAVAVLLVRGISVPRLLIAVATQIALLLSGQPEITAFGFIIAYLFIFAYHFSQRTQIGLVIRSLCINAFISVSSVLLSAWALIPVGKNALESSAAESRGKVAWTSFSQELEALKSNLKNLIFQFLDPSLHSSANPYKTALSPYPFSRLTAWVGFVSICLIIATLVVQRRKKLGASSEDVLDEASVLSLIRYLTVFAVISCFISLRTPWTEALCSRIPLIASMDRNLFRYLTSFFLFVAALACVHILTKKVLIISTSLFVATRILVLGYLLATSRSAGANTKEFRDNLAISGTLFTAQRMSVIFFSLCALVLLYIAFRCKSAHVMRIIVGVVLLIEISQIFVIRPHNWVQARPTRQAQDIVSIVNKSGHGLIAPNTFFATIGTWLEVPSPSGYSLVSDEQHEYLEDLKQCTGLNDYAFISCGYDKRDEYFYDISNVGWVITSLDSVRPEQHNSLIPFKQLENGFTLFKRKGSPSPLHRVDAQLCSSSSKVDVRDVEYEATSSKLSLNSDPDVMNISIEGKVPSCGLIALSYDEGYTVTSGRELPTRDLGGFLLVDLSNAQSRTLHITFQSPGRSQGIVVSLTFLLLVIVTSAGAMLFRKRVWIRRKREIAHV